MRSPKGTTCSWSLQLGRLGESLARIAESEPRTFSAHRVREPHDRAARVADSLAFAPQSVEYTVPRGGADFSEFHHRRFSPESRSGGVAVRRAAPAPPLDSGSNIDAAAAPAR